MNPRDVGASYRAAWREYRGYVAFVTAVFLLSALGGGAMAVAGVDLAALFGAEDVGDLLPDIEELSQFEIFLTILLNNARAFVVFVLGAASLGAFTLLVLAFNGFLIGYVVVQAAAARGVLFVVLGIGPHGILELPALFVGAAVGFRLVVRTLLRLAGPLLDHPAVPDRLPDGRASVMSRAEWRRTGLVVVTGLLVLAVAAAVEAYVTAGLLAAVFG